MVFPDTDVLVDILRQYSVGRSMTGCNKATHRAVVVTVMRIAAATGQSAQTTGRSAGMIVRSMVAAVLGFLLAAGAANRGLAQQAGAEGQAPAVARPAGPMPDSTGRTVVSVATNATVATELGLTEKQLAALKAGLDSEKVRRAVEAQRLAELVAAVLTDAKIAADLGVTEAQQKVIKQGMTAALIQKAFSPDEISRLARSVSPGGMMRDRFEVFRQQFQQGGAGGPAGGTGPGGSQRGALTERMKQYDTDGDGQLSDTERRAAFQNLGGGRFGGRGARGGGQGPRGGGQPQGNRPAGGNEGGKAPADKNAGDAM
jgi:hypothetical protein